MARLKLSRFFQQISSSTRHTRLRPRATPEMAMSEIIRPDALPAKAGSVFDAEPTQTGRYILKRGLIRLRY